MTTMLKPKVYDSRNQINKFQNTKELNELDKNILVLPNFIITCQILEHKLKNVDTKYDQLLHKNQIC